MRNNSSKRPAKANKVCWAIFLIVIALACVNLTRAFAVNLTDSTTDISNTTDSSNELIEMEDPNTLDNQDEVKQEYDEIVSDIVTDDSSEPTFAVATDELPSDDTTYPEQTEDQEAQNPKETISDSDPPQDNNQTAENSDSDNDSEGSESQNTADSDTDDSLIDSNYSASQEVTKLPYEGLESNDEVPEIKQEAINRGQKLVAVIDTGAAGQYAEAQVNFTDEIDVDEMGHGSFMSKIIKDNADNKAYILSLKAFSELLGH